MKLGYVRVSTKDQNTERQLRKMRELEIDERYIFVDKQSGKDFNRPKYQAMRLIIRERIGQDFMSNLFMPPVIALRTRKKRQF